ncbi:DUF2270 domain-containing protein [bacterium]|nr:DUF2270 domain-containing protein [bacterium]
MSEESRPQDGPAGGFQPQFPPLDEKGVPQFEDTPLTRGEYITALAHFYRAEMHRALVWRTRLDTTTNWAILATLAILTASLNNPGYATESLLLGMFANVVFLTIEARRFRFFDVWRARVRMLEENFYGGILRRDQASPLDRWGQQVADDLLCPRFHMTRLQAVRARLMRNFRFIFLFLLVAWVAHRLVPMAEDRVLTGLSGVPGWMPDAIVAALYLFLLAVVVFTPKVEAPELAYWSHPEHPGEDIPSIDV